MIAAAPGFCLWRSPANFDAMGPMTRGRERCLAGRERWSTDAKIRAWCTFFRPDGLQFHVPIGATARSWIFHRGDRTWHRRSTISSTVKRENFEKVYSRLHRGYRVSPHTTTSRPRPLRRARGEAREGCPPSSPRRAPLVPPTSRRRRRRHRRRHRRAHLHWLFASATNALGRRDEVEETRAPPTAAERRTRARGPRRARAPPRRGARHDSGPPHGVAGTRAPPELHPGGSGGEEEAKVKPNLRLLLLLFLRGR